jgi:hypothetical protein
MSRHLGRGFFESTLNRGKAIECFVGGGSVDGAPTVRWVAIRKEPDDDDYVASLREVYDPRDPEFLDVGEFQSVTAEPDEPIAEQRFTDLDTALAFATKDWGASEDRFVVEGMVGHEYEEYLRNLKSR